ncbi:hypothetical protein CDN99_25535 [Roseateles aquatilis]|uniref:Uncharacterized protein n=1 Tax=Roseateles aquatilis TaxID=431061 RepID=A0A246IUB7_9BURK|nr:hypothetical protein [Roseateles aquatilis]OWQ83831.1 hypothetical protein CDN99_25535 [Roseateles aquatilis]
MSGRVEQLLNQLADEAKGIRSQAEERVEADAIVNFAAGMERVIGAVRSALAAESSAADPVREDLAKQLEEALTCMVRLEGSLNQLGCPGEAERLAAIGFRIWRVMRALGGVR